MRSGSRTLAFAVAVLAMASCGGGDGDSSGGGDVATDDPEAVADAFIEALATGDTVGACDLLSETSRASIAQDIAEQQGSGTCEEVIAANLPVGPESAQNRRVCRVSDQGDQAYVNVVFTEPGGVENAVQYLVEQNEDGSWGVDSEGTDEYGDDADYLCNPG